MYIARVLYPIRVLGPGDRIGIWFCGCEHECIGCSNPELWEQTENYKTSSDVIIKLVESIAKQHKIDGFTLTGGDPFYQPEALRELLPKLKNYSHDILCYTGYDKEYVSLKYADILDQIGVLIDGKYIENRNNNTFLRGSDNQKIHILSEELRSKYESYLANGHNEIQNFTTKDSVISVGIHEKEYNRELNKILNDKGLVTNNK